MHEHVCTRCGDYLLLFPAENIVFIEPVSRQTHFCQWMHRNRRRVAPQVLDLRRLLGVRDPTPRENCVTLQWRSTDGARQIALLVDAVEEIVNCPAADLIEASSLPRRLRPLCDQVMHDPRGGLRLRVKPDARLPFDRPSDRRRYALALLTTHEEGAQAIWGAHPR